jgi:hypothetical protein
VPAAVSAAERYVDLPDRSRAGIQMTIARALNFLILPECLRACTVPGGAGEGFGFREFLASRDTLYLVAGDETAGTPVTGLFLAIATELAHVARMAGAEPRPARPRRGRVLGAAWLGRLLDLLDSPRVVRRLDPPLRFVLDEFANTAPVPVHRWSSWAAGSGVQLMILAQSLAQVTMRWGQEGAAVIWQCCRSRVVLGGTAEPDLARWVAEGCGTARVRVPDRDPDGWMQESRDGRGGGRQHGRRRWVREEMPLITADGLRTLPDGCAVVLSDRGRPAIVRMEQARRRGDVRAAQPPARAWRRGPGGAWPERDAAGDPVQDHGGSGQGQGLAPGPAGPDVPGPGTWPHQGGPGSPGTWAQPGGDGSPEAPRRTPPVLPSRPAPWEAPRDAAPEDKA